MNGEIKSIFKVVSSNAVNMIIGVVFAFIIPGLLGPVQYGYYSLFTLYVSYAGFFLLGFCDGFYLVYGGLSYQKIDKKTFTSYFYILIVYLISIAAILFFYLSNTSESGFRLEVFYLVLLGGFFYNVNGYFILLNQATARFNIYSFGNIIEKVVLLIGVLLSFYYRYFTALYFIAIVIIGKLLTSSYYIYHSRDIVFQRPQLNRYVMKNSINNIKVGFLLTISGVGTMLMSGIGRFLIEKRVSIEAFGYYSFMFSVSVIFTQVLSAIGVVLYPSLRKYDPPKIKSIVNKLDRLIIFLSGIVLITYYPGRYLLEQLFPKYKPGMVAMLFLFPIVICESRRLIVYDVVYKVLRMEKQLVHNVILSISSCFVITLLGFQFSSGIEMVAMTTYISFVVWNTITVFTYNRIAKAKEKLFGKDLFLCLGYLAIYYLFDYTLPGFVISVSFIMINFLKEYKEAILLYRDWKTILGAKNEAADHVN